MSGGFEVTLRGTWTRKNTHPGDITMMRRLSARLRRDEVYYRGGEVPLQFAFKAKQDGFGQSRLPRTREGTFVATVFIPDTRYGQLMGHRSVARAKQVLKWFLQDTTCRPPQLTFTDDDWRRRFRG